ncbi:MAG: T9SS type A sorting domain-containing protein [Bacteroidota bacterium]
MSRYIIPVLLGLGLTTSLSSLVGQSWAWKTTFGGSGSEGVSALAANDLGLIFGGSYDQAFAAFGENLPAPLARDLFVGQLDQNGDLLWLETPGSPQTDRLVQVISEPNGESWWFGDFWDVLTWGDSTWAAPSNGQAIFMVQTDATGQILQHIILQGSASMEAVDIIAREESLYLLGTFTDSLNIGGQNLFASADRAGFLAKLDLDEGWQWCKALDGAGLIRPEALAQHEERLFIAGSFNDSLQNASAQLVAETWDWDGFVASYSAEGEALWLQKVGAQYDDFLQGISTNAEGHLFVAGTFPGVCTDQPFSVSKTPGFNTNVLWLELASDGTPLRLSTWGNLAEEESLTVHPFKEGVLLTGRMGPSIVLGTEPITGAESVDNGFLAGISTQGRVNWGVPLQADELILATDLAVSPSGEIYAGGAYQGDLILDSTVANAGQFDGFLARLAPEILSILETSPEWGVKISPNPNAGVFVLEAPLGAQYRLLSANGVLIEAGELRSEQALFQQESGSYFLEVYWKGRRIVERIVVQ